MHIMILLGNASQNNARLFYGEKEDAEQAFEFAFKSWEKWKADNTALPYLDMRDSFEGRVWWPFENLAGIALNSLEGNEETAVNQALSNAITQMKTNNRVNSLTQTATSKGNKPS